MKELMLLKDDTVFHCKISRIRAPDNDEIVDIQIEILDGPLNNISFSVYIMKEQGEWRKY